ncbi:toll/interleukin-1 receptor domain-containing protein [Nitrosomonas sp. JL21]|uniref:toll/interleukin-1 receptor domain-containing protein n=1 Tax=Nitrosomonas sp. JL21 TaxID=153949 RepID=UPI00136FD758|nr:toll/interleukin-1 receptor domain-containing protein [Nitrosomonas sp. JL21]MBL8496797.1 toll/interleukin-1 receptor domain-containing protein [Nitrosomonas sp.]MBL8498451.1 toll/interleukin-1 receptor domain-containing protein [Nitrosomonas sp.]MXS78129.1 toll/interleukin-1 receptor domain-containing protein [Nitrosomonas sp. JL21]
MTKIVETVTRNIIFISKATPGDDEFVLWLAPRLEAAGYIVFADVLSLEPGDRWRKQVTGTLQNKAIKMLLCCRDSSLDKDGVQEEIGIALDLVKELDDPRFIIPLRLENFKKIFGIGELQWINFVGSWANGLHELLETLETQGVPCSTIPVINRDWESYRNRLAIKVEDAPEVLTSNWLRIASIPDIIRYFQPTGSINHALMENACRQGPFPSAIHLRGFFSFMSLDEVQRAFANVGRFEVHSEHKLLEFIAVGSTAPTMHPREAQNMITSMFRQSWESFCRSRGLYEYAFSQQLGFHVSENQMPLKKRISWGKQDQRRNSMLRNSAGGKVWQYGVSANSSFWPFPHFKIKSRVLFAELVGKTTGKVFDDPDQQHRLRRSICKGWRNKAWHGRLMAFLELLSEESQYIELLLSGSASIKIDATPLLVTSPVTTILADVMADDAEEQDLTTLGNFHLEENE